MPEWPCIGASAARSAAMATTGQGTLQSIMPRRPVLTGEQLAELLALPVRELDLIRRLGSWERCKILD